MSTVASAAPPPATATAAAMRRATASMTCVAVDEGGIDACARSARVLTGCTAYSSTYQPALRALLWLLASLVSYSTLARDHVDPQNWQSPLIARTFDN